MAGITAGTLSPSPISKPSTSTSSTPVPADQVPFPSSSSTAGQVLTMKYSNPPPLLTEPQDPNLPAFHVVAPSLPGYAWSEYPDNKGLGLKQHAETLHGVMKACGYESGCCSLRTSQKAMAISKNKTPNLKHSATASPTLPSRSSRGFMRSYTTGPTPTPGPTMKSAPGSPSTTSPSVAPRPVHASTTNPHTLSAKAPSAEWT